MENKVFQQKRSRSMVFSVIIFLVVSALFILVFGQLSQGGKAQAASPAQPEITWPHISLVEVTSGLDSPDYLTHAGDNSGRIFIVEQSGRIRVLKNKTLQSPAFLNISERVLSPASGGGSEEGLLGLTFPPNYAGKGYFYVYYTNKNGNNVVARFHLAKNQDQTPNPDLADPATEEQILLLNHPSYANHNGGQLAFGPDGYLYVGTGDGGGGGDPFGNAQNPNSFLGKILRINVEPPTVVAGDNFIYLPFLRSVSGSISVPYQIQPSTSPNIPAAYQVGIWALGLRNPWRFSFDRKTKDLYIGDVGQDRQEEVDFQPASESAGINYGWNILEGTLCYKPSSNCVPPSNHVGPVVTYDHGTNDSIGCSITGGYVYRGTAYPTLDGIYFYGDYCTGRVWGLQRDGNTWQYQQFSLPVTPNISSFGEDQAGEVYLVDQGGKIYQITTAQ